MIKYIIATLTLIISISCTNHNSSSISIEPIEFLYNDSPNIIDSPTGNQELRYGLKYGKIIPPSFPDSMKMEKNLLTQIAAYNSALIHGDFNTCSKYLYPAAFEYYKRYYPNFPDDEIIEKIFAANAKELQEIFKSWKSKNIEYQLVVYNFEKKITYGDNIIIIFNITSNISSEKVFLHLEDLDKTIGISHNNGVNWWFMNNHEDLPTILGKNYPSEVVNAIMGY